MEREIEQELELIERGVEKDLEEAVEKLNVACDLSPSALKYNIEPNTEEPFEKGIIEPTCIKVDAKDLPKPVTYYEEVEKILEVDVKINSLPKAEILEPVNIILEVTQYPETVTIKDSPDLEIMKPIDISEDNDNLLIKTTDASLSNAQDVINNMEKELLQAEKMECNSIPNNDKVGKRGTMENAEQFCKEFKTKDEQEKDEDSMVPRKKEKIDLSQVKRRKNPNQMTGSLITVQRRDFSGRNRDNLNNRRSVPAVREKKRTSPDVLGKSLTF